MNKRFLLKNEFEKTVYCVLSPAKDYTLQFKSVFGFDGGGLTVEVSDDAVCVIDLFTRETLGRFKILSVEDTDEELLLNFKEVEAE